MTEREKLIDLLQNVPADYEGNRGVGTIADFLVKSGVIMPPVKVGDVVYMHGEAVEISFMHIDKQGTIYCIQFDCSERDCDVCPFYEDGVLPEGGHDCITYGYIEFTSNDIGNTVFLSREEAEKALEERKKENETR